MSEERAIWFPAKTYGYGWGLPVCWQGWVVLGVYTALMFAGGALLLGGKHAAYFVVHSTVLTVALIGICAWKGDSPRWRWGGK